MRGGHLARATPVPAETGSFAAAASASAAGALGQVHCTVRAFSHDMQYRIVCLPQAALGRALCIDCQPARGPIIHVGGLPYFCTLWPIRERCSPAKSGGGSGRTLW